MRRHTSHQCSALPFRGRAFIALFIAAIAPAKICAETSSPDVLKVVTNQREFLGTAFPLGTYGPLITARHVAYRSARPCGPEEIGPPTKEQVGLYVEYGDQKFPVRCFRQPMALASLEPYRLKKFVTTEDIDSVYVLDVVTLDVDLSSLTSPGFRSPQQIVLPNDVNNYWKALGYHEERAGHVSVAPMQSCHQVPDLPTTLCPTAANIYRGMSGGPLLDASGEIVAGVNAYILSNLPVPEHLKAWDRDIQTAFKTFKNWLDHHERHAFDAGAISYVAVGFQPAMLEELVTGDPASGARYVQRFRDTVRAVRGTGQQCTTKGNDLLWGPVGSSRREAPMVVYFLSAMTALMAEKDLAENFLYCNDRWLTGIDSTDELALQVFERVRSATCLRWKDLPNYQRSVCNASALASVDRLHARLERGDYSSSSAAARAAFDTAGVVMAEVIHAARSDAPTVSVDALGQTLVAMNKAYMMAEAEELHFGTRSIDRTTRAAVADAYAIPQLRDTPVNPMFLTVTGTFKRAPFGNQPVFTVPEAMNPFTGELLQTAFRKDEYWALLESASRAELVLQESSEKAALLHALAAHALAESTSAARLPKGLGNEPASRYTMAIGTCAELSDSAGTECLDFKRALVAVASSEGWVPTVPNSLIQYKVDLDPGYLIYLPPEVFETPSEYILDEKQLRLRYIQGRSYQDPPAYEMQLRRER